jgi:lysozyme
MPDNKKPDQKPTAAAALIALAVAVAAPLAAGWEGFAPKVYRDPANIPTYCYGETQNVSKDPTRIYAKTECMELLRQRMARDYAPAVYSCLSHILEMDSTKARYFFGAFIDASYNAGASGVCRSPMVAAFNRGDLKAACNLETWKGWYASARYRGKPLAAAAMQRAGWRWNGKAWVKTLKGLQNRRAAEAALCAKGLAA